MKKSASDKWSCAVVDDDVTMVAILENYISQIPKLKLVGSYTDPKEALNKLGDGPEIDFLFLDIKMEIAGWIWLGCCETKSTISFLSLLISNLRWRFSK